jgi:subfamily B ATP-binding cassette protein MsbA
LNSYYEILAYIKPYWQHILLTFVFTTLFAILNGMAVYLTIPLLDTLFQESASKQTTLQTTDVENTLSIQSVWINKFKEDTIRSFNDIVLSGEKS